MDDSARSLDPVILIRDFGFCLGGVALSTFGSAVVLVTLSFAVLNTRLSTGALGIVLAAWTIPAVALLLVSGVVGNRWPP